MSQSASLAWLKRLPLQRPLRLAIGLLLLAGAAAAQDRGFRPPPDATIQRDNPEARRLSAPGLRSVPAATPVEATRQASLDLDIRYIDGQLWDPGANRYQPVHLRGYMDHDRPAPSGPAQLVGPTIRVTPGDTVRMTLRNTLPSTGACPPGTGHGGPGCSNSTNLHSHGLWVSPTGNSDNVLLDLPPGSTFQYEYNIPADHPAGTFWYHPHRHGAVALQVGSGMAGALIVQGDRKPGDDPDQPGDIDVLTAGMPEKLLVFSQIPYGCFKDGKLQQTASGALPCGAGEVGMVENFYDQLGFGSSTSGGFQGWPATGRYTTVNGVVQPSFALTAGQPERWRLLHAGTGAPISFAIVPVKQGARLAAAGVAASREAETINATCNLATPVTSVEIQADGLTRATAFPTTADTLQPGYRSDLLVAVPQPGQYCLLDLAVPDDASRAPEPQRLLGVLEVAPAPRPVTGTSEAIIRAALVQQARQVLAGPAQARVVAELADPAAIGLGSFVWHRSVAEAELTGQQYVAFAVDNDVTRQPTLYHVNFEAYDPARVDRTLPLLGVEQWVLTAPVFPHVFHIHVNPFQIVSVTAPDGSDATDAKTVANNTKYHDPQYVGMAGVWRDTVFVNQNYTVTTRTRYQRYIGEFVLHCHILDHEDQGMMQNISIVAPGLPGPAAMRAKSGHTH